MLESRLNMASSAKLLNLPKKGQLVVAAELRGNLRDFLQVVDKFERLGQEGHLLFLGNLIHGPYLGEGEWPECLGRPYRDGSPAILLKLSLLMERYPGRVFALLGNHEYAHLGGPRTSRFAKDEVAALCDRLGADAAAWLETWLSSWPLLGRTAGGILLSHAAPAARFTIEELSALDYMEGPGSADEGAAPARRLLGKLLWSHSMRPEEAREVLARLGCQVAVYSHDIVRGHETIRDEQLILSSSFGLKDRDKRVLMLDLETSYASVAELRPGTEIVPLYS